jgi:chromosome segregation ATPase
MTRTMSNPPPSRWLAAGLLGLLICGPATAQDSASREREALRRAQSALQQAQQQRDGLQAEKATLERAQADHAALAKQQQAQLGAAQSELKRLRALEAEHAALQAQLGTERQTLTAQREQAAADQAQAATRLADANRQTLQLRAERDEMLNANRALVGKLEAATVALAEARERNRQLHAVGQDAVDRLRGLSPADRALQGDRILGLTGVRIDNEAEDLLQRLDAQRQPAAAP